MRLARSSSRREILPAFSELMALARMVVRAWSSGKIFPTMDAARWVSAWTSAWSVAEPYCKTECDDDLRSTHTHQTHINTITHKHDHTHTRTHARTHTNARTCTHTRKHDTHTQTRATCLVVLVNVCSRGRGVRSHGRVDIRVVRFTIVFVRRRPGCRPGWPVAELNCET